MSNQQILRQKLLDLDNRNYKAYKDILGSYEFPDFTLIVDYVQGDPFAAPTKIRVQVPHRVAGFPQELYSNRSREIALRDYLSRQADAVARALGGRRGTGKSGSIAVTKMGQEILERTSVYLIDTEKENQREKPIPAKPIPAGNLALERGKPRMETARTGPKGIELRLVVGLPASGRRILGRQGAQMLCDDIPQIVRRALKYEQLDAEACRRHVETAEDADWLREQLPSKDLVAFVANGSILPRRSGVDDRPLASKPIPFESAPELEVEFDLPNNGKIKGMGIPAGVTLIAGGGYHGKSTLLRAMELGVYNRVPGDGREFVVTHPGAVKVRAEDGRSVVGVDISPFINQLPQGRSTAEFTTENASGSTSQAANIMEALEAGLSGDAALGGSGLVLLVDEDTAATNFMIRDRRMQELISKDREPIVPFIDKVRQLYTDCGVSTILVMGGSGDYFDVADLVIAMENFQPNEVTSKARAIAKEYATGRTAEGGEEFGNIKQRVPLPASLDPSRGRRDVRLKVRDVDEVVFGNEDVDLAAVEQLVSADQLRAIAAAMVYAKQQYMDGYRSLAEILDAVMEDIRSRSLEILVPFPEGDLAMFRRFELAAAINRLRTLEIK
ncbi:MAG: ABC-ATPase domain-containing protein [Cyanobacteriota bacterium]|nr:ABC-ATPase domain-containing protein [Cyanobacteriota bacterium]